MHFVVSVEIKQVDGQGQSRNTDEVTRVVQKAPDLPTAVGLTVKMLQVVAGNTDDI